MAVPIFLSCSGTKNADERQLPPSSLIALTMWNCRFLTALNTVNKEGQLNCSEHLHWDTCCCCRQLIVSTGDWIPTFATILSATNNIRSCLPHHSTSVVLTNNNYSTNTEFSRGGKSILISRQYHSQLIIQLFIRIQTEKQFSSPFYQ